MRYCRLHLSELPASFNPAALGGLLDRLAAFRPGVITIETESGEECDMAARHPGRYGPDYWFDDWLGQLQGVDIVDVARVLK